MSKYVQLETRLRFWGALSLCLACVPAMASTSEFRGVNWADPRDKFIVSRNGTNTAHLLEPNGRTFLEISRKD